MRTLSEFLRLPPFPLQWRKLMANGAEITTGTGRGDGVGGEGGGGGGAAPTPSGDEVILTKAAVAVESSSKC